MDQLKPEAAGIQEENNSIADDLLRKVELTQTQLAALLGVTPQAVSKGLKEDGITYFGKESRAQRLYSALMFIGGDRYNLSASRLKELAPQVGWGSVEETSNSGIRPIELYEKADELWVISNSPAKIIDWEAMKNIVFSERKRE